MIAINANKVVYKTSKINFFRNYIMFEQYKMNTIIPIYKVEFIDYHPHNTIVEFSKDGNIKAIKEKKGE